MEVGKKYTHKCAPSVIYECVYLYNTHDNRIATGAIIRNSNSGQEFATLDLSGYIEFKNPVIEYRISRVSLDRFGSTLWWTPDTFFSEEDPANVKATFTDGVLTKVELLK